MRRRAWLRRATATGLGSGPVPWPAAAEPAGGDWRGALGHEVARIERGIDGRLGLYLKRLADGTSFGHRADRFWYLASATKVPTAIAVLQQVDAGRLLSPRSMAALFAAMQLGEAGNHRLQGGFPRGLPFIHKTGTHHRRACQMGVIDPAEGGRRAIVVCACVEGLDEVAQADRVLARVGEAIRRTVLAAR